MKARKVRGLEPSAPLRPNAERIVATRLAEMLERSGPALDPAAAEAQHDLRISAKRLRYVLEIVESCFGPEAKAARKAAKGLQAVLGEIHDCDVMLSRETEAASLRTLLHTRRELLFQRFRARWLSEFDRGTWSALERSLRS